MDHRGRHQHHHERKFIESEMDLFEKEISSLAPPPTSRSFLPAQLRRPMQPPGGGAPHQFPSSANAVKPSPIIISGAPQVYNANAKPATISKPPETITSPLQPSTVKEQQTAAFAPSSSSATGSFNGGVTTVKLLENPKASTSSTSKDAEKKKKKKKKKKDDKEKKPKKALRSAGGQIWEDFTLQDWDPSDFRLFCGDLGNDVTDEVLTRVFGRYPSFQKAKVVRDKRSNKTKGFGFVSFKDPNDFVRAIKELDGRYVGSRPIKLRKSNWKNRNIEEARKKDKERAQLLAMIKK